MADTMSESGSNREDLAGEGTPRDFIFAMPRLHVKTVRMLPRPINRAVTVSCNTDHVKTSKRPTTVLFSDSIHLVATVPIIAR